MSGMPEGIWIPEFHPHSANLSQARAAGIRSPIIHSTAATTWGQSAAAEYVLTKLAPLLPGEAWKGPGEDAQK